MKKTFYFFKTNLCSKTFRLYDLVRVHLSNDFAANSPIARMSKQCCRLIFFWTTLNWRFRRDLYTDQGDDYTVCTELKTDLSQGVDMSVCLSVSWISRKLLDRFGPYFGFSSFLIIARDVFFIFWICLFFRVATIQKNAEKPNFLVFLNFLENGAIKVFHFLHVEYMLSSEHFGI